MNEQHIPVKDEPIKIGGGAVNSVNGQTGDVVLTPEDVGALPDTTVIPTKTSELTNDSNFATTSDISEAVDVETTAREGADNDLQSQIDAISAASDVKDVVGTYAELEAYDTSALGNNDIIKVLEDEEENDATTYYRWDAIIQKFTLIGEEGPYYTKAGADAKFQDKLTAGTGINIDANNEISTTTTPINVVQTTGTSTTDVMSQKAASNLVYPPGNETSKSRIAIGNGASTGIGSNTINIGVGASSSGNGAVALGWDANAMGQSVALGVGSSNARTYEIAVGKGSGTNPTRFIANVTDPTLPQDAATKNYVDIQVGNIETILQTINSGTGV